MRTGVWCGAELEGVGGLVPHLCYTIGSFMRKGVIVVFSCGNVFAFCSTRGEWGEGVGLLQYLL